MKLNAYDNRPGHRAAKPAGDAVHNRTLVRMAIAMLLHRPSLTAALAESPARLITLDRPGIPLLVELLEFLQTRPHVQCSAILEHWRGNSDGQHLAKLATSPLEVPEDGLEVEFNHTIMQLLTEAGEQQNHRRADELIKIPIDKMTSEQKTELQTLLSVSEKPKI